MKTSRIVLWSGAAFLALLILFSLILMRISISRDLGSPSVNVVTVSGESSEISIDTTGITALHLKGGWQVGLERGESGGGTVIIPVEAEKYLELERRGPLLYIGLRKGFPGGSSTRFSVDLVLESLESLHVEGAGDLEMTGFREEQMKIVIEGAADISARDVQAEYLIVKAGGAANLSLGGALFVNVDLDMEGAANAELQMNGGILSGRIAGLGSVSYGGTVSEEKIRTEGIASVKRR
jgi:Putative auto-transporter adhesin, head GIN domain